METTKRSLFASIFKRPSQGVQSTLADAAPVDAAQHTGKGVRMGERTRRARRKVAPSLFDNCSMVKVSRFEVRCPGCGVRACYAIRPSPDGKGRRVVCDEVFDGGVEYTLAEAREAHSNQCEALEVSGLDFRAIATLAGETYLVVRKPSTVAANGNGDASGAAALDGQLSIL